MSGSGTKPCTDRCRTGSGERGGNPDTDAVDDDNGTYIDDGSNGDSDAMDGGYGHADTGREYGSDRNGDTNADSNGGRYGNPYSNGDTDP